MTLPEITERVMALTPRADTPRDGDEVIRWEVAPKDKHKDGQR